MEQIKPWPEALFNGIISAQEKLTVEIWRRELPTSPPAHGFLMIRLHGLVDNS
jgi:hypothetical protein|tara:strand:- start:1732 stop:1890 length:159 start_codon:yes stop_codon:yes gene_type:complete